MSIKKVLWLEDQHEDFSSYGSAMYRAGYIVDSVQSVSDAVKQMRNETYIACIFDIKVLPGNEPEWKELDKIKRIKNPDFDSYLGLELLRSLFNPDHAMLKLKPPLFLSRERAIVLSCVADLQEEVASLGIPVDHYIYKSNCDLDTLPQLIRQIEEVTTIPKEDKGHF